tara:strand:+ start:78 stop:311 length:234 start_codon:yes stop_codon:yes gene_type:complete
MKITIEELEETNTFETKKEGLTAYEMVEVFYRMLHAAGYHPNSIDEAFLARADELEAEERREAKEDVMQKLVDQGEL